MMNVAEEIKNKLGEEFDVTERTVLKNNGVERVGYTILKIGEQVAPTIYREDSWSDEEVADNVIDIYNNLEDNPLEGIDLGAIMSADYIYKNVIPVLVNREKNSARLETAIHRSFLDLEVIYKVRVGDGTITIDNTMARDINLDLECLHESAMEHLASAVKIDNILDILRGMGVPVPDPDPDDFGLDMIILSNNDKVFGAAGIMLESAMQELHNIIESDDIIILPSSIHEVIAVPYTEDTDRLSGMVSEVNSTQVAEPDILSSSIYHHNRDGEWEVIA